MFLIRLLSLGSLKNPGEVVGVGMYQLRAQADNNNSSYKGLLLLYDLQCAGK